MKKPILFFLLVMLSLSSILAQPWQRIQLDSLSQTQPMMDGMLFQDTGVVIGENGSIFYSTDFFESFTSDTTYYSKALQAMSFANRKVGYIVFSNGQGSFLKTIDGGETWNVDAIQGAAANVLFFTNPDTGYAAFYGDLRITLNAGLNWSLNDLNSQCPDILRIQFTNDSTGYILSNDDAFGGCLGFLSIFKTVDYGSNWQLINDLNQYGGGDLFFTDDTTAFVVTSYGIFKSTDGGYTFNKVMNAQLGDHLYTHMHAISFANRDTGFVAYGAGRSIYKTYDAGNTWIKTDFYYPNEQLSFIKAASGSKVIVGCNNGNIYKTETGGGLWSGIKDVESENSFTIYPNPATTKLTCVITNFTPKTTLQILSIDGREIMQNIHSAQNNTEIDVSRLPAGFYFLVLQDERQRAVRRFVKE